MSFQSPVFQFFNDDLFFFFDVGFVLLLSIMSQRDEFLITSFLVHVNSERVQSYDNDCSICCSERVVEQEYGTSFLTQILIYEAPHLPHL